MEDSQEELQPGVIRFAGITEADKVTLDGELIPSAGLRRINYNLLIAPGVYTLKVQYAETGRTCSTRVVVEEERTVEPSCTRAFSDQQTD